MKLLYVMCLSMLVRIISAKSRFYAVYRNGSLVQEIPRSSRTDLINMTVEADTLLERNWDGEFRPPIFLSPLLEAYPMRDFSHIEYFYLACYFNRTVNKGELYESLPNSAEFDPCFNYAKETLDRYFTPSDTLDIFDKVVEIKKTPFSNQHVDSCGNKMELAKRSLWYDYYITSLNALMEVSTIKSTEDHTASLLYENTKFYCSIHTSKSCFMNPKLLKARCLTLYLKNIKGVELL